MYTQTFTHTNTSTFANTNRDGSRCLRASFNYRTTEVSCGAWGVHKSPAEDSWGAHGCFYAGGVGGTRQQHTMIEPKSQTTTQVQQV
jgi:hypothetical protein